MLTTPDDKIHAAQKLESYKYVRLNDLLSQPFRNVAAELTVRQSGGVIVLPLSEALKTYGNFLKPRLKHLSDEEKDPFVSFEHSDEGLFIYVPPKLQAHLEITHHVPSSTEATVHTPRLHIFVGKEAELTLKHSQTGSSATAWVNAFVDCALEERAFCTLIKREEKAKLGWHFDALRATLKRESQFKSYSTTQGAATSRHDYRISLRGEGADASLYGLWDLQERNHHHTNILMEHVAPHCTSLQKFKGILSDSSRSSFEGKIYVHREAQKTDAYQMNNNLILGPQATAYSKPNLEIFADDVKASHGATTGQLDKEQLFYLKTRGLSHKTAQRLLVEGFVHDILDLIPQ